MEPKTLKILALIFLVLAIVAGFVAWERYAATGEQSEFRLGEDGPAIKLEKEPVMPVASKYAIFLGLLFLAAAGGCAYAGFTKQPSVPLESGVGGQASESQKPKTPPTEPHPAPGEEESKPAMPPDQPPRG